MKKKDSMRTLDNVKVYKAVTITGQIKITQRREHGELTLILN